MSYRFAHEQPSIYNSDIVGNARLCATLTQLGFEDNSWHNDAAASYDLSFTMKDGAEGCLRIWIDDARPWERETFSGEGPPPPRFGVQLYDHDLSPIEHDAWCDCEQIDEILAFARGWVAGLNARQLLLTKT